MQTQILGLLAPMMSLFFAAMFIAMWRIGQLKRHVLGYALSFILSATAFLVTHFLPADGPYTFHATQLLYSLASIVMLAAVCERAGQRLHLGSMAVVYVISALLLAVTMTYSDDAGPSLIVVNTGYGVMFAMGVTTLLTAPRRDPVDFAMVLIMAINAADFLVRPTLTLLVERSIPTEQYRDSIYYSLIGLVLGVKGLTTALVMIAATISEWTKTLRDNGDRDALTGLRNRGAFEQIMLTMIPRAQAEGKPFSLVVADIDHFKQVNDIFGHQAGDRAITTFGELIATMIRGCDVAGRIGGEEFCVAVWNCENEPAERLAERIRQAFGHLEHAGLNDDIRLTASFGVATACEGETYERLFARADAALYRAKSTGRNRVENAEGRYIDDALSAGDDQSDDLKDVAAE